VSSGGAGRVHCGKDSGVLARQETDTVHSHPQRSTDVVSVRRKPLSNDRSLCRRQGHCRPHRRQGRYISLSAEVQEELRFLSYAIPLTYDTPLPLTATVSTQPPILCGRKVSNDQGMVMLCGWGVKTGWLNLSVNKRVDDR